MKEIDLFTPLQADFYPFDEDAYEGGYNDVDGIPLDGSELVDYQECIQAAVREYNRSRGSDLMPYFTGSQEICEKVFSATPDVAVRHGSLWGVTHLTLKENLTESEFSELADYLTGQYADGWGEGFEQQKILLADGDLYVHFWRNFGYQFQTAQGWYGVIGKLAAEPGAQEPAAPQRPKLRLKGQDGNIFAILGRAMRLLKECGQADKAQEMADRVCACGDYHRALHIISEYVDTELSEKPTSKGRSRKSYDGHDR